MGLKVENCELIHALFGLRGFRRLQLSLWFLEDTQEQASMSTPVPALWGSLVYKPVVLTEGAQLTEGSSWSVFSIQVSRDCRSLGPWYLIASWSGLNNFSLHITSIVNWMSCGMEDLWLKSDTYTREWTKTHACTHTFLTSLFNYHYEF